MGQRTTTTAPTPPTINLTNPLNLFLFRSDINFGVVVQALQQKNLLQILAEPNLIAVNGKEASFLAGGEFPFPIVQPGQGFTAVSISFKEFGVRLRFTPVIMPNGNIHLRVVPEVSQLDFTNGLTISGFNIPALSTRRADTEFELQDGQSFVIAGLIDNRLTNDRQQDSGAGRHSDSGQSVQEQEYAKEQDRIDGVVHSAPHRAQQPGAGWSTLTRSRSSTTTSLMETKPLAASKRREVVARRIACAFGSTEYVGEVAESCPNFRL